MKLDKIVKRLQKSGLKILTLQDLKRLLEIEIDNTAYKTAENLVKKDLLLRIKKGIYASSFYPPEDFEIAGYLYSPSYISLESALNFYGILSQFPYTVTSISPRKTKKFSIGNKEYEYIHIQTDFFWGYDRQKGFLIAMPEKALMDAIYLVSKGWRKIDLDELDYSRVNKKIFKRMAEKVGYRPFQKLLKEIPL
jgi:predicted transcriptional regulator of viral defense system